MDQSIVTVVLARHDIGNELALDLPEGLRATHRRQVERIVGGESGRIQRMNRHDVVHSAIRSVEHRVVVVREAIGLGPVGIGDDADQRTFSVEFFHEAVLLVTTTDWDIVGPMTDEGLPQPDVNAAGLFWERYLEQSGEVGVFTDVACFGDSVAMADELLELVINGPKRATAGAMIEYEIEGLATPAPGDRWIACSGSGAPRAVVRTTEVRIGPLSSVDDAFAWDEGEGDRTRDDWLRGHTAFFVRRFGDLGETFHPDIDVCFERFDVPYTEPDPTNAS